MTDACMYVCMYARITDINHGENNNKNSKHNVQQEQQKKIKIKKDKNQRKKKNSEIPEIIGNSQKKEIKERNPIKNSFIKILLTHTLYAEVIRETLFTNENHLS